MSTENYTPFGEEWKKEMMKWKKEDLIDFLKTKLEAQSQVKNNVVLDDVSKCTCRNPSKCGNCDEMVVLVSEGYFCPSCFC